MKTVKENMQRVVDVFACADGGVDLVKFRFMMEKIEQAGTDADIQLLDIFDKFVRLVDVVTQNS